ncbi:MAG: DeoR/GlpR family DNA-binding transcription regulator [Treponemataceae bacterium]
MFALERVRVIRNYLAEHRQAEVHALSSLLAVSEVTVRRDLEKLEEDGFLVRTHGGAILAEAGAGLVPFRGEKGDNPLSDVSVQALADEVGRNAARLVSDGDTVMITCGPLTRALARSLSERRGVTVLTNDLEVARVVSLQDANRAVLLGGEVDPTDQAVYGALSLDDLQRFHVDRLFAELDGFGEDFELSSGTQEKAALIREGRARTREFVILCTADRFFRNAFFRFGVASGGDTVVTDRTIDDIVKRRLFEANLRLFISQDIFEGSA